MKTGLRRALKIGCYKNDPICVLTTVSVLWELRLLETDGVKCAFYDNEYFCCTDTPSMSLSYPLQADFRCLFLIKSLFKTNTHTGCSVCLLVSCIMIYCSEPRERWHFDRRSTIRSFNCHICPLLCFKCTQT